MMFNPVYPFTTAVLEATINTGCTYFVRNHYPSAMPGNDENVKACYLISHYDDEAKAMAHFNAMPDDGHRFFYDWQDEVHQQRLKAAAANPVGFRIYSTYFYPDYKRKITPLTKSRINQYMYDHTDWKPQRGETVHLDFYIQFGALYATMSYAGQKIKVKFDDIESSR